MLVAILLLGVGICLVGFVHAWDFEFLTAAGITAIRFMKDIQLRSEPIFK